MNEKTLIFHFRERRDDFKGKKKKHNEEIRDFGSQGTWRHFGRLYVNLHDFYF